MISMVSLININQHTKVNCFLSWNEEQWGMISFPWSTPVLCTQLHPPNCSPSDGAPRSRCPKASPASGSLWNSGSPDSPHLFKLILVIPSSLQMIGSVGTPWPIRTIFPGKVVVEQAELIQSDWTKGFVPWFRWKRFTPFHWMGWEACCHCCCTQSFPNGERSLKTKLHTKEGEAGELQRNVPEPWLYVPQSPNDLWSSCCTR